MTHLENPKSTGEQILVGNARVFLLLGTLMFSGCIAYGPSVYTFTLFLPSLEDEFGWNRAILGGAISIFWLTAPLSPMIGSWMDRHGTKWLLVSGSAIVSLSYIGLGYTDDAWTLYLMRVIMGLGKIFIVSGTAITIAWWFNRSVGTALGFAMAAHEAGGFIFSPITQYLIDGYGWRSAAISLGILIALLSIPPFLALLPSKRKTDDSLASRRAEQSEESDANATGLTLREALSTRLFRTILALTFLFYMGYASLLAHLTPYLTDLNFSSSWTAGLIGTIGGTAAISTIILGAASDRLPHKWLLLTIFSFMAFSVASALGLSVFPNQAWAVMLVVVFGMAVGTGPLWSTILRTSFGDRAFGAIFGTWYLLCLTSLLISPILIGILFDMTHSYRVGFWGLLGLLGVAITLILMPGFRPVRKSPPQAASHS